MWSKIKGDIIMKKKTSTIIGLVMFIIALIFIAFSLVHPELSWPWSHTLTVYLYAFYATAMVLFIYAPFDKKSED